VIGQMLDKQRINLFELKCFGDEFYLQCGDPQILNAIEIVPIYSANDFNELLVKFGILKIANPRSVSLGLCSIQAGSNDPFCAFATGYFLRYTVGLWHNRMHVQQPFE
jgi:hypothetical protein